MSRPSWEPSSDSSMRDDTCSMTMSVDVHPLIASLPMSLATSSTSSVTSAPNDATMLDVAILRSISPFLADVPMPSPALSTASIHMLSRSASFTSNASMSSTAPAVGAFEGNPSTDFAFPLLLSLTLPIDALTSAESPGFRFSSLFSQGTTSSTIAPASLTSGVTTPTSDVAAVALNTLQRSPRSLSGIWSPTQSDAEGDSASKAEFCFSPASLQHEDKEDVCLGTGSGRIRLGTSAVAISRTPTPFVTVESVSCTPTPSVTLSRTADTTFPVSVIDAAESINRLTPDIGPVSPVTPEMDDELPIIQGLNKHELFEFVHSGTRHEWEATPGPKVVIFIAGDTIVTHDQLHSRVLAIRNVLKKIFPESDPIVGSAEPVPASHHHQPVLRPVFPYLISGISILQAQVLTTRLCWPMSDLTFFALDLSPPSTPFVMTLSGLHLPLTVESNEAVASLIRQKLFASSSVTSIIRRYNENLPPYLTRDEFIQFILSTVEVKGVRLGNHEECPVVFNVYIHPPTNNPHWHRAWLQEVRSVTFFAAYGTGKATPIFHCDTCKGRDHAVESCPFPMPGQQFLDLDDVEGEQMEENMYPVVFYFMHI
ncbi:hypothetical protein JOM56_014118 [Amanita muscaria]